MLILLKQLPVRLLTLLALSSALPSTHAQHAPALNPPTFDSSNEGSENNIIPDSSQSHILSIPSVEWTLHKTGDSAHPNGNEQAMVWLMNRARSNPEKEGIFLAETSESSVQSAISFYGVDVELMKEEFADIPSRAPAAFDRRIYLASEEHSLDLIARDTQDHNNQFERVVNSGFKLSTSSFSVFSYAESPLHGHAGFNIDWGSGTADGMQTDRGHRAALMNSGFTPFTNVGIAMVTEDNSSTQVGPLVASIAYAFAATSFENHFNKFLVGTVWDDLNNNGLYDSGEGLAGVSVTPDSGTYFAVTGDSGGYSIPVSADGDYIITFSGEALNSPQSRTVTVSGESVLVPWNQADSYNEVDLFTPTPPKLRLAQTELGIEVSWNTLNEQNYQLQNWSSEIRWENDDRLITTNANVSTFLISNQEALDQELFRIVVSENSDATSSVN